MTKIRKKIEGLLKRVRKLNEKIKKLRAAGAKKEKKKASKSSSKKSAKKSVKMKSAPKKRVAKPKSRPAPAPSVANGSTIAST